ncbi:hypothetical protein DBR39_12740 [Chryseobacterium sp. KBW03]|uniref:S8 family peptidase n=1 Tax=Chryseobacterium sp. KBW03 TaxID=2153362 RepID=UPI000F5A10C5|nr:S8 family serine peptidase [Chryseobacterium sp. KBW03]RQO37751.1 hypothetical protein DBR39_12740 [Chryseobacterium sp. KBW03]
MRNLSELLNETRRYYYYNGKRVYMDVDPNLLLITFKEEKEPEQQIQLLNAFAKDSSVFKNLDAENLSKDKYVWVTLDREAAFIYNFSNDFDQPEIENISQVFIGEANTKMGLTPQILVQIERRFQLENVSKLYEEYGVSKTEAMGDDIYLLTLDLKGNLDPMDIANIFFESGYFAFAEPNFFRSINTLVYTPNDPNLSLEWHIPSIGANSAWCWKKGENIKIGIMDVGINTSHPDLQANHAGSYDPTGRPLGADGHGTPCAGCALAVGDNNIGVAGVAFKSRLYQIRVGYNPTSNPNNPTFSSLDSWVVGGMDYAFNNGIDIISASIGLGNPSSSLDTKINNFTINGRGGKGGIMLGATGNDGGLSPIHYPARHANVFAVGSSDSNGVLSTFSNYDGYVEFLAPGESIFTTIYDGSYWYFSGTSAATPVAAGCAALILSAVPSMTRVQLRDAIDFNCDKTHVATGVKPTDRTLEYGYGVINVANFFASYYSIQGSTPFCGSQSQYNVANLPAGTTVTSWNSNNPNLPVNAAGLVTNPSGQAGRTVLTANLSNTCTEPRQKVVVAGSYPQEVWAVSSNPADVLTRYWADGNNPNRTLGILKNYPSGVPPITILFGYAPSVGKTTLNPPNTATLYFDNQGWSDSNNGVTSVEVISAPPTLTVFPYSNAMLVYTTGDPTGILEVKLGLPCGPVNVKFYLTGLPNPWS